MSAPANADRQGASASVTYDERLARLPVHAYIVMFIDMTLGIIPAPNGIGCFSEPEPSVSLRYRSFVLIDREGKDFEEALKAACREFWTSPMHKWAHGLADKRLKKEKPRA